MYAGCVYAGCVYVGTEANYQEYQKLALQRQVALEEESVAQMNAMDWDMGGWGW